MRKLNLIMQPKGSKLCGQHAIAMATGITIEESIKLFGHKNSSYYRDYVRVLTELGYSFNGKKSVDNRKKYTLPKLALVRLQKVGRRTGHLITYCDGKFYDSCRGVFNSKEELMSSYNDNIRGRWRIDWYMEILGKDSDTKAIACGD